MKTYFYQKLSNLEKQNLLKRPTIDVEKFSVIVKPILLDIKQNGLSAALKYAKQFDGFIGSEFRVTRQEFEEAEKKLDSKIKKAIITAAENIRKFHSKQIPQSYEIETMEGIKCSREFRAIENVGLYIPGGSAVLPSTMLMLGIPAQLAGCKRVVVCSPAKEGKLNFPLLFAARLCGIDEFYKIGGAQAIGLMAYGDINISKVDKIIGPGNQFVTTAKLIVSVDFDGSVIDMPAGPSEVLVIADENTNPEFAAADLLSQAEHGADSQVVLVSTSENLINQINKAINVQLEDLPRKEIAKKALEKSFALIVENIDDAICFSNSYAPEHLILNINDAESYKSKIINAGSVFVGQYSPESVGDYASGTNHSLPTYGYAKTYGGVSVDTFMKSMTFQKLSKAGLKNISGTVETLAEVEELIAHKNAVRIRTAE
ncbi:MAG TPA: histidinol dehydrogenase [Ignavibacteriaceae bacterium]|nr:histidinol dehydrogenase [Ignavibacteriaceae bacterium]